MTKVPLATTMSLLKARVTGSGELHTVLGKVP